MGVFKMYVIEESNQSPIFKRYPPHLKEYFLQDENLQSWYIQVAPVKSDGGLGSHLHLPEQ